MSSKKPFDDIRAALPADTDHFKESVLDLFTGKRSGHLGRYVFSSPLHAHDTVRGNEYWSRFIHESRLYYPNRDIIRIIKKSAGQIAAIIKDSSVFVDLGGGTTESFDSKILPLLSHSGFSEFVCVDLCNDFSDGIADRIKQENIPLKVSSFHSNIFESLPPLPQRTTLCLLGITLGNIVVDLSRVGIKEALTHIMRHFSASIQKNGGYFIFDYDTSTDGEAIISSYENPHYHAMELTILDRIKRDLNTNNFAPEQFEHVTQWHPDVNLLSQNIRAKCDMSFTLEGQEIRLPNGTMLHTGNSFKYADETIRRAASAAGLQERANFRAPDSTMRLAVYSA